MIMERNLHIIYLGDIQSQEAASQAPHRGTAAPQPLGGGIAGRIAANVAPGGKGLPAWPAAAAGSSGGSSADVSAWPRLVAPRTGATAQAADRVKSWPLGGGIAGRIAADMAPGGKGLPAWSAAEAGSSGGSSAEAAAAHSPGRLRRRAVSSFGHRCPRPDGKTSAAWAGGNFLAWA